MIITVPTFTQKCKIYLHAWYCIQTFNLFNIPQYILVKTYIKICILLKTYTISLAFIIICILQLCLNSWGTRWGELGSFRIRRNVNESMVDSIILGADLTVRLLDVKQPEILRRDGLYNVFNKERGKLKRRTTPSP